MKNELDDFLEGIKGEIDPFEATVTEPETAKEGDIKEGEEEEKEEKPLPFHKDPKVQRYVEKEITKALANVKVPETIVREKTDEEDSATDVLIRIIGNDTPEKLQAVKDFKKVLNGLEEKGAQRALKDLEERQQQAIKASQDEDQKAEDELREGFEEIEESYGVDLTSPKAKKLREEFVEYVRKIAPKKGGEIVAYPDLPAAFEEFQSKPKKVVDNSKAKALAARGISRSSDASVEANNTDKSWASVDRLFSKIKR